MMKRLREECEEECFESSSCDACVLDRVKGMIKRKVTGKVGRIEDGSAGEGSVIVKTNEPETEEGD